MSDTDLSDEAFTEWCTYNSALCVDAAMYAWREAARRAELKIAELQAQAEAQRRKDFGAGAQAMSKADGYPPISDAWLDEAYRAHIEKEGA